MSTYCLSHLSDPVLLRGLASLAAQDRVTTAALLAHIAECDARKLYLPAAFPSMFAYCVQELRLSEDAASKRIQAARVARRFPVIFGALADGRLHLTAVGLLAPYLTPENGADLIAEASHRTKPEIEELLARRFPRSETLGLVQAVPVTPSRADEQLAPGRVEPGRDVQHAPAHVGTHSKLGPIAPEQFELNVTIGRTTHDKLRHAQDLLGHELPSGELAQVLDRALDALIQQLEKRKFAATTHPRQSVRPSPNPRHIPAHVKRTVWARDGGQCTFGAGFMHKEREAAQRAATSRRREAGVRAADEARRKAAPALAAVAEVIAPLRSLGFSSDEARRAASLCEAIPDAALEQRVRRALSYFRPRPGPSGPLEASHV